MIPERAYSLVPTFRPEGVSPWIVTVAEREFRTAREVQAFIWAMHLLDLWHQQGPSFLYERMFFGGDRDYGPSDVSAGFIRIDLEKAQPATGKTFRVVPDDGEGRDSWVFGVLEGRDYRRREPSRPAVFDFDEAPEFAIVRHHRVFNDHHSVPILNGAASCCYAKPLPNKRFFGPHWHDGLVIARHVLSAVGYTTGARVPIRSGGSLPVADIDPASTTIDAAILDLGLPPIASRLALAPAVAPGTQVAIAAPSRAFTAQVLRVNDHPFYFGNLVAHRYFIDQVGVMGDSGSLVTRSQVGDAVGLYIGETGTRGALCGKPEGILQSLRQVAQFFEIDLYA